MNNLDTNPKISERVNFININDYFPKEIKQ